MHISVHFDCLCRLESRAIHMQKEKAVSLHVPGSWHTHLWREHLVPGSRTSVYSKSKTSLRHLKTFGLAHAYMHIQRSHREIALHIWQLSNLLSHEQDWLRPQTTTHLECCSQLEDPHEALVLGAYETLVLEQKHIKYQSGASGQIQPGCAAHLKRLLVIHLHATPKLIQ